MRGTIKDMFRRSSLTKKDDGKLEADSANDISRFLCVFDELLPLGLEVQGINGRFYIRDVTTGGPAALQGLSDGDELLEVNGKKCTGLSAEEMGKRMQDRPLKVLVLRAPVSLPPLPPASKSSTGVPTAPLADSRSRAVPDIPLADKRYDVLHKVPIVPEVRNAPAIPPLDCPPEPKTGWRWRPCHVNTVTIENGRKVARVSFLDDLVKFGYPAEDNIPVEDRGQNFAPLELKSPSHLMQHSIRSDDVLDVLDYYEGKHSGKLLKKWRQCQVVAVAPYYIRVTFCGWNRAYDLWLHVLEERERLAEFGTHTLKEEAEDRNKDREFRDSMLKKGYKIVDVEGDGNCMFRAVSLLLFGTCDRHTDIRKAVCDYMEGQPARFSLFMDEGETFADYIARMRKDKTWGDEPELRVIEELYDRPISMYSCDIAGIDATNLDVTAPIAHYNAGEEVAGLEGVEPLRLSYHGSNHYNAVVKVDAKPLFEEHPEENKQRIRRHRSMQNGGSSISVRTHSFSLKRSNSTIGK